MLSFKSIINMIFKYDFNKSKYNFLVKKEQKLFFKYANK